MYVWCACTGMQPPHAPPAPGLGTFLALTMHSGALHGAVLVRCCCWSCPPWEVVKIRSGRSVRSLTYFDVRARCADIGTLVHRGDIVGGQLCGCAVVVGNEERAGRRGRATTHRTTVQPTNTNPDARRKRKQDTVWLSASTAIGPCRMCADAVGNAVQPVQPVAAIGVA